MAAAVPPKYRARSVLGCGGMPLLFPLTPSACQHRVIVSDSNLVSICGGKWTTYRKCVTSCACARAFVALILTRPRDRRMAEDTIDKVLEVTPVHTSRKCATPSLQV